VVCFCDIPETDLAIHVSKYSKFGLAFKKEFLIKKGASPVLYVANETPVDVNGLIRPIQYDDRITEAQRVGHADRALFFDTSVKGIFDLLRGFDALNADVNGRYFNYLNPTDFAQNEDNLKNLLGLTDAEFTALQTLVGQKTQAFKTLRICTDFLCNYVFSFIKCFDANRTFDDEKNYYMEREWRIANNVKFDLTDVSRVFLPAVMQRDFVQMYLHTQDKSPSLIEIARPSSTQ
jgi:hypothetical protein